LIVLVAIPTSLITAFAVMWLLGYTLNLMTLLAMSLIIGILVDDATVVLENIQRHLDMGKEKKAAAMDGRMEIGFLLCLLLWLMWWCLYLFYFYRFLLPICSNNFR
jgi:HAE1 family hydrophobic/amphiphilic exporter-1